MSKLGFAAEPADGSEANRRTLISVGEAVALTTILVSSARRRRDAWGAHNARQTSSAYGRKTAPPSRKQ